MSKFPTVRAIAPEKKTKGRARSSPERSRNLIEIKAAWLKKAAIS
jgi:hypothetical protein